MADPVFYFRGAPKPPTGEWLRSDLVSDVALFAGLGDEQVEEVANDLSTHSGFLNKDGLKEIVGRHLGEVAELGRIASVLWFVLSPPFVVEDGGFVRELSQSLRRWQQKHADDANPPCPISPEEIDRIERRLERLVADVPSFERQKKATRLQSATGQALEHFEMICDLRPIFDADRERIEGWLPLTHLKLVSETEAGLPVAFEAVVSESMVRRLHEAAGNALKKLASLRRHAEGGGLQVPRVRLTRQETVNE